MGLAVIAWMCVAVVSVVIKVKLLACTLSDCCVSIDCVLLFAQEWAALVEPLVTSSQVLRDLPVCV